ncbi:MAG: sugar phosphate isomerase/epimerase family protein [Opitutales bacterium]
MHIGSFALVSPFCTLDAQLAQIAANGFTRADVTDNSDGACLGAEFGFTALASLDANAFDIKRLFEKHGITITSFCAHSNLLDPVAPWRYSSAQIIKAIRAAAAIGVKHVITTEGEPSTDFGHQLSESEQIFTIADKLYEPLRMAQDYGIKLLFEPHGPVSDSIVQTERLLEKCNSPALGLNLDTGNLWLGGGDPIAYVKRFGSLIEHVHWKDMPAEMEAERGKRFGCGMAIIALGDGVVGIDKVFAALKQAGFDGDTTLEIAGDEAVNKSRDYLLALGA